jgi:2,4-dienoyl-CoA reductase-like NADH-dependent reductase (Old Yellow Enzyme family)
MATTQFSDPGQIGKLSLKNRFIRSATSESMAGDKGEVTDDLRTLYRTLARGGAGLIFTGHMYIDQGGAYSKKQTGIHDDSLIPGLKSLADEVHNEGGVIFAEVTHAGSQSQLPESPLHAPSPIPNAYTGRTPSEMSSENIELAINAFGQAARRAAEAGFDGVHLHGHNGYLLSEFCSPYANHRDDQWGGDAKRRGRFLVSVCQSIRQAIGPDVPFTLKLGVADHLAPGGLIPSGGLTIEESVERAAELEEFVDGIEASVGVVHAMPPRYSGVGPQRALQDWLFHRLLSAPGPEAYLLPQARALKNRLEVPIIAVGGIRTTETMERILADGDADFLSLSRPFIREPDIANQILSGRRGLVDCVSCNMCLDHEGFEGLRCWRKTKGRMAYHAYTKYWRDRSGA